MDWKNMALRAAPYLIRAILVFFGVEADSKMLETAFLMSAVAVPSIKANSNMLGFKR